ncbi:MAG: hypothetical protein SGPRY_012896 [Prymnesium sp.]
MPCAPLNRSLLHLGRRGYYAPAWPYDAFDFSRLDENDDAIMYSEVSPHPPHSHPLSCSQAYASSCANPQPRFVTHLDDDALLSLTKSYRCLLAGFPHAQAKPSKSKFAILDTCASWKSYLPEDVLSDDSRVAVQGLNRAELDANKRATERVVANLNRCPKLPFGDGEFDLVTNVSSVDYLTDPRAVFGEIHRVLRPGGCVAVAFSNRCFDSKAVALWLRKISDGAALAEVVCNYLHFGATDGWAHISCADVSPQGSRSGDPLYLVVATKKL